MNNIKLWIGEDNYPVSKKPWLPTIDSVLQTQILLKNKYKYKTVIIFIKNNNDDFYYPLNKDMIYTSSATDSLTQHLSTDSEILIRGYYDYYDGVNYFCYLILYSNTFNDWNVINDESVYAVYYDEDDAIISQPYVMNEWRISKNVKGLKFYAEFFNVPNLIIPNGFQDDNATFEYFYPAVNTEYYRLFDEANELTSQTINTFGGLIYSLDYGTLLTVPRKYKGDSSGDIILNNLCQDISKDAFGNGTIDMHLETDIDLLYGLNVSNLSDYCLCGVLVKRIVFPNLKDIKSYAVRESEKLETFYFPASLVTMEGNAFIYSNSFINPVFEVDFGKNMTTPIHFGYCNNFDVAFFASQLYNLATIEKGSNTIIITDNLYSSLSSDERKVAEDKGWGFVVF